MENFQPGWLSERLAEFGLEAIQLSFLFMLHTLPVETSSSCYSNIQVIE
jgi:hypothetical protein